MFCVEVEEITERPICTAGNLLGFKCKHVHDLPEKGQAYPIAAKCSCAHTTTIH